jgi:hypothetical protein
MRAKIKKRNTMLKVGTTLAHGAPWKPRYCGVLPEVGKFNREELDLRHTVYERLQDARVIRFILRYATTNLHT